MTYYINILQSILNNLIVNNLKDHTLDLTAIGLGLVGSDESYNPHEYNWLTII